MSAFGQGMTRLLLPVLLLAGCSGRALAATQSWQVGDASRIRVEGPFDVRVRVSQPSSVRATGAGDAIDRLSVEQRGDVLVLRPRSGSGWGETSRNTGTMVVEVGLRSLVGATLSGSGDLKVDRIGGDAVELMLNGPGALSVAALDVGSAKVTVNGSGDLSAAGHARSAAIVLNGTGDVHAAELGVGEATVTLIGSGDVRLAATRTARVTLQGSGDVTIDGPAQCEVTRSGSGDVRCGRSPER